MKNKKGIRIVAMVMLLTLLCTVGAFASNNSYQSGNQDFDPPGNYSYYAFSLMDVYNNSTAHAGTYLVSDGNVSVPTGYMGTAARLFSANGSTLSASGMIYNTSPFYFQDAYTDDTAFTGFIYSKGQVSMYTGTTYLTYDAPQTIAVSGSSSFSLAPIMDTLDANGDYPMNSAGQTYGSALVADVVGYEPDLISAVGTEGGEGYVLADDLDPAVSSPVEALAYMVSFNDNRTIPLYDVDGHEIGTFELTAIDPDTVAKAEAALEVLAAAENQAAAAKQAEASTNKTSDTTLKTRDTISVEETQKALAESLVNGEYPKNSRGETYGSWSLADVVGHEPDLISAVGTNGVEGYVRATDMNGPVIHNPDEAAEYMATRPVSRTIPLYDLDGNTVGEFVISSGA